MNKEQIEKEAENYANLRYNTDANPIDHESITKPFIAGALWMQSAKQEVSEDIEESVFDELSRELESKAATSCASITKEYAEKFAEWIGEKRCNDDWFRYDETLKTWYIHMKGHVTTSELWDLYLNDLNEKG